MVKTQLEALLRRWDLEPIILDQQPSEGKTIIEKLEDLGNSVNFAIVLATPDDECRNTNSKNIFSYRVRQNVALELGMFLAKLGRSKVAILIKESENFDKPSDIQGLIYIPFKERVEETSISLLRELWRQGYKIDNSKI